MSARAGDWELVGRSEDPVPGDPDEVHDEARHYSKVATTIEAQARRLRNLAEPDAALKGHYADELQEGMSDLADDLDTIHGRFHTAGSQLTVLEPALRTVRTETKAALDAAAEDKEQQKTKVANDPDYDPPQLGPFEKSQPEKDCDSAMARFGEIAERVASAIRKAADDDMKDSRWDKFKGAVGKIAPVLKFIAKALTYIALVAAFFVAPWIVALLLLGSLLINTLLAVTDNGSWVDVAFDVVGLLTLGIGTKALQVARAGRAATLTRAAKPAASAARSRAFASAAWNNGRGVRGLVSRLRPSVRTAMRSAYADEFARVTSRVLPEGAAGLKSLVRGGMNPQVAGMMDDLAAIRTEFPGVRAAISHVGGITIARNTAAVSVSASATAAAGDIINLGKYFYSR